MSLVQPRLSFRLLGRSFIAFVLTPERPLDDWLTDLDGKLARSASFFGRRPIILDLSGLLPTKTETAEIISRIEDRELRLIAVEGVDADWVPKRLAPLPGVIQPVGMFAPGEEPKPNSKPERRKMPRMDDWDHPSAPKSAAVTLLIEEPVRSGQSIIYPDGDVTVVGSVASGAEIIAGGSIHVYGTLRGRAFAGTNGNAKARIFCNKFDAEILVIDGLYRTADEFDPALLGTQVQARLDCDAMNIETLN